jgi:CBS domain-containing protein
LKTAADIMTAPVESIEATATVAQALEKMRRRRVSSLLVLAEDPSDSPGFLTQTDIVTKVVARGLAAPSVVVADAMSRPVITVPPQTSAQDCARLMGKTHIRRVLVHDGEDVVGIVSASDILDLDRGRPAPA